MRRDLCFVRVRAIRSEVLKSRSGLPFAVLQVDRHIAELTVRETLDFAARCQGVGHKAGAKAPPAPVADVLACKKFQAAQSGLKRRVAPVFFEQRS